MGWCMVAYTYLATYFPGIKEVGGVEAGVSGLYVCRVCGCGLKDALTWEGRYVRRMGARVWASRDSGTQYRGSLITKKRKGICGGYI